MVLGPAQGQSPLQACGGSTVHQLGNPSGADEAHRGNSGMITDCLHNFLRPVHHVEHSGREPSLSQQLGDPPGTERDQLRRLEDHAVAQRDRIGNGPVGYHDGKVDRHDRRNDPNRIAIDRGIRSRGSPPAPHRWQSAGASRRTRSTRSALAISALGLALESFRALPRSTPASSPRFCSSSLDTDRRPAPAP